MMGLQTGSVFASNYEIVQQISAGGMGVVYEVVHLGTRRRRALKIMLPHIVSDPRMRERFSLEATVAADIQSEHITEVFDAGIDPETKCPYLVMELLRGEDLGARLKRAERFTAEETVALMEQAARALEKTHERGIIHRDLKPDNLFVTRRDDGAACLKILDFGIAKVINQEMTGPQATTSTFGTPYYMAREQITGESALIGPSSDLYAVAHIVFSMLTGAPYFQEEAQANGGNVLAVLLAVGKGASEAATTRALRRGVELPSSFDGWFARATALFPRDRYQSARAMMDDLRSILREPLKIVGPNNLVKPSGPGQSGNAGSASAGNASAGSASAGSASAGSGSVAARGVGSQSVPELLHDTGGPQSLTSRAQSNEPKKGSRAPLFIGLAVLLGASLGLGAWRFSGGGRAATPTAPESRLEAKDASTPSASSKNAEPPTVTVSADPASSASVAVASASVGIPTTGTAAHPPTTQRPKPVVGSSKPPSGEVWETR